MLPGRVLTAAAALALAIATDTSATYLGENENEHVQVFYSSVGHTVTMICSLPPEANVSAWVVMWVKSVNAESYNLICVSGEIPSEFSVQEAYAKKVSVSILRADEQYRREIGPHAVNKCFRRYVERPTSSTRRRGIMRSTFNLTIESREDFGCYGCVMCFSNDTSATEYYIKTCILEKFEWRTGTMFAIVFPLLLVIAVSLLLVLAVQCCARYCTQRFADARTHAAAEGKKKVL
ncbi:hypothetical protein [Eastern grey kangaroopox virus]|uniref:Uncharacterized protein n=1 Tax=Eastern grey kangaroopox virus TaxID=2042482 RepID=A0A2C9DTC3_9POXV|nr:hypothetical protein KM541_gp160 [Eastern grey kangaroopox virus]ATI21256.1 hypothetical protein [Eastern grey kangaroopox virus]ATX75162.1 hypothetical protein EKPV-NSW-ORF178 [Eastern grey kangaroopox virus]